MHLNGSAYLLVIHPLKQQVSITFTQGITILLVRQCTLILHCCWCCYWCHCWCLQETLLVQLLLPLLPVQATAASECMCAHRDRMKAIARHKDFSNGNCKCVKEKTEKVTSVTARIKLHDKPIGQATKHQSVVSRLGRRPGDLLYCRLQLAPHLNNNTLRPGVLLDCRLQLEV